ncbi:MAG: HIT family protein [Acidimicrobiia bacterium]
MSADCLFCKIVAGEAPAAVVLDQEHAVAFLDVRPVFVGHTLVVPRGHVDTLVDLPAAEVAPFFTTVQRVAAAVQAAMGAQGSFVAMNNVVSQSVPHLHVHVVPRTKGDGLRGFFWPRVRYESDEQMEAVAGSIRLALESG